jgi:hypothetical protein
LKMKKDTKHFKYFEMQICNYVYHSKNSDQVWDNTKPFFIMIHNLNIIVSNLFHPIAISNNKIRVISYQPPIIKNLSKNVCFWFSFSKTILGKQKHTYVIYAT